MTTSNYLLFLATWLLVALSPGPAAMCAMSNASRFGMRAAMIGILGIQLGHFVFFGCIAAGLATALASASTVFSALRILGALYLAFMGIRMVLSSFQSAGRTAGRQDVLTPRSLLWHGLAIQLTNPKALLFMSALLPQFIQPKSPLFFQLFILLTTTIVVDVIVLGGYAFLAHRGAGYLRSSRLLP